MSRRRDTAFIPCESCGTLVEVSPEYPIDYIFCPACADEAAS